MQSLPMLHKSVLEAISYAARKHQGQLRKDHATPYAAKARRLVNLLSPGFPPPWRHALDALREMVDAAEKPS